jgi:asparagine synthase (glutamine-hydrolysing)
MCGITGWASINKTLDKTAFLRATSSLSHRGPEAEGFYFNSNHTLALGHRRLKIIDLSEGSAQPFTSACGRYIISYNGEIYNFKDIAQQLNLQLKTSGDTEVIIEAFAKIGTKVFGLLNGIFALCIYDSVEDKIYLSRDRMGVKPLFYYFDGNQFAFASETKAIRELPGIDLQFNKNSFLEYLHLGFVPEPYTSYKNIYKFPAGNSLTLQIDNLSTNSQLQFEVFWNLYDALLPETYSDEIQVEKELERLLYKAVESQLVSDVPVGTFLSGGVDSSLITALASKIKQDKIKTFSIGFQESRFDESAYAEKIASQLGTEHYTYRMTESDLEEILHQIISTYDCPFFDSSTFPTMLLSKYAKNQVTVALSGEGGDELFMGYGMHQWSSRLEHPLIRFARKPLYAVSKYLDYRYKKAGWLLNYNDYDTIRTHIFSQEQSLFGELELKQLSKDSNLNVKGINAIPESARKLTPKEKQSFWDINYYLRDDLLVKIDRSTMLYSLESRVPLLDNDVIDYAINIDTSLKHKNGESKYILKKILYKYLPKEFFDRPKQGFSMPLALWLKTELKFLLDKYLASNIINRYNIVSYTYVEDLKNRFLSGEHYLYGRIWAIIILHWWLETNA